MGMNAAMTQPAVGPSHYGGLFARFVLPHWRSLALLGVLLLSTIGLQLLGPLLLRQFIDNAMSESALGTLTTLAATYALVALLAQIVGIAEAYVAADVAWRTTNELPPCSRTSAGSASRSTERPAGRLAPR